MDMPVDEPRKDEPAGGFDKGPAARIQWRFRANLGYFFAADYDPAV